MAEITVSAQIGLFCEGCGGELDATYNERLEELTAAPCRDCLKEEREEGYDEGFAEAKE